MASLDHVYDDLKEVSKEEKNRPGNKSGVEVEKAQEQFNGFFNIND